MAVRDLDRNEIRALLTDERLVRVAFSTANELYVITLGYVYHRDALYGVTSDGRKTRIASEQPRVALQVDSSIRTGPFGWSSVTGEGVFGMVADAGEAADATAALQPRFKDAPEWWRYEQAKRFASGILKVWRIRPERLAGRHDRPPVA